MKTNYSDDLNQLIEKLFKPSSPSEEKNVAMSLTEIYNQVTNVLPAKWIYEADVFECLKDRGFETYPQEVKNTVTIDNKEEVQTTYVLKYFLKVKL